MSTIADFPVAAPLDGSELVPLFQGGAQVACPTSQLPNGATKQQLALLGQGNAAAVAAGAAADRAQAAVGSIDGVRAAVGGSPAASTSGSLANVGAVVAATGNAWGVVDHLPGGYATEARITAAGALTARLIFAAPKYRVQGAPRLAVTRTIDVNLVDGVNHVPLGFTLPSGACVYAYILAGAGSLVKIGNQSPLRYFAYASWNGAIGAEISDAIVAGGPMAIEVDVVPVASLTDRAASTDTILKAVIGAATGFTDSPAVAGSWPALGAPNITALTGSVDVGVDIAAGTLLRSWQGQLCTSNDPTSAQSFTLSVFARDTAAANPDTPAVFEQATLVTTQRRTLADLGLATDGTLAQVAIAFPPIVAAAGKTYSWVLSGNTAADAGGIFGAAYGNSADPTRQRRGGFYVTQANDYAALPGVQLAGGFTGLAPGAAQGGVTTDYYGSRVTAASCAAAGFTLTSSVTYGPAGAQSTYADVRQIAPTSNGQIRYDRLFIDPESKAFGIIAGAPRASDPGENIPATTSAGQLVIANIRVTTAGIEPILVYDRFDSERRALAEQLEAERRRSRVAISRFRGKVQRGLPVHVVSIGDSIEACANIIAQPKNTANGQYRDIALGANGYYQGPGFIGADILATIPTYTAAQLGRAADSYGAIYSKTTHTWQFITALQAAYGQALGAAGILYDNYCVAGSNSSDLVNGTGPSAWMLAAIALAPDLMIFHMGMNEYGQDYTDANMLIAITAAQAAGIECWLIGAARRIDNNDYAGWTKTNRKLQRVAEHTKSAFTPTVQLYDDRNFGAALGFSLKDASSANHINHPGPLEHRSIGLEMIKMAIAA